MGFFDILKKDERESYYQYVGNIPYDIWIEIVQVVDTTFSVFNIKRISTGKTVVTELQKIVDDILMENKYPPQYGSMKDVAIALGICYGDAISTHYHWKWKMLGDDPEHSIVSLVSPNGNYSIQPMHYMLRILNGETLV